MVKAEAEIRRFIEEYVFRLDFFLNVPERDGFDAREKSEEGFEFLAIIYLPLAYQFFTNPEYSEKLQQFLEDMGGNDNVFWATTQSREIIILFKKKPWTEAD